MKDFFDLFKEWLDKLEAPSWLKNDVIIWGVPIIFFLLILWHLYKSISFLLKIRNRKILNKDLTPYYSSSDVYRTTKNYIDTRYQNVSPSEDDEPGKRYLASAKNKLIPVFLKKVFNYSVSNNKYYLVLADSGMGKTTFLINLYIKYKNKRILPWNNERKEIKLIPLGAPNSIQEIQAIENKQNTILLLDAFDEDVKAIQDYKSRMNEILENTWKFNTVVISCRTQFFPSQKEEPYETGYFSFGESGEYKFQKIYLSTFGNSEINKYLNRLFPPYNFFKFRKLLRAKKIVKKCPNLMVRPMLLSHIEDIVASKEDFYHTYQLYKILIDKWIQRESRKPGIKEKFGVKNYEQLLYNFSSELAYNLFKNRESRGGYYISKDEEFQIDGFSLNTIEDEYKSFSSIEKKSKSLLNRNAEGKYKFSHKSILEFFIAERVIQSKVNPNVLETEGISASKSFYNEMAVDILRNIDGFYFQDNKRFPLNGLKERDLKFSDTLQINNFADFNPDFLICFDSLRKVIIADSSLLLPLHVIYQLFLFTLKRSNWIFSNNENLQMIRSFILLRRIFDFHLARNFEKYPRYVNFIEDLSNTVIPISPKEIKSKNQDIPNWVELEELNMMRSNRIWIIKEELLEMIYGNEFKNPEKIQEYLYIWDKDHKKIEDFLTEISILSQRFSAIKFLF